MASKRPEMFGTTDKTVELNEADVTSSKKKKRKEDSIRKGANMTITSGK
jgi:hypothetical protein